MGNVTANELIARANQTGRLHSQIFPKGTAMNQNNLSPALAKLIDEAAQLQYIVDCESEYCTPSQLDRYQKRIAYLCKLIDRAERMTYCDTAH